MSDDFRGNPIASFAVADDNFTSGENKSRLEVVQDDLLGEFAKVIRINGYRSDTENVIGAIRHPDMIPAFPEIGVVISQVRTDPKDDACTVFMQEAEVMVQAAIQIDTDPDEHPKNMQLAVGRMQHDLSRCMAGIFKTYITTNDHKWNVKKEPFTMALFTDLGMKQDRAAIILTFKVHIRNLEAAMV